MSGHLTGASIAVDQRPEMRLIGEKTRLILFDLDGVLVDSLDVMAIAWEEVRTCLGVAAPFEAYASEIGRPFADIVRRLGYGEEASRIKEVYDQRVERDYKLIGIFPGVEEMLGALREGDLAIGVVTSKDRRAATRILDHHGIATECLMTPDEGMGKPSPELLWRALETLCVSPEEAVYVGDMEVDRTAALNAELPFIHAAWGYGGVSGKCMVASNPAELAKRQGGEETIGTSR